MTREAPIASPLDSQTRNAALRRALDEILRESLRPSAIILGALYVVVTIGHLRTLPPEIRGLLSSVSGLTALVLIVLAVFLGRWKPPGLWLNPIGVGVAGLILANSLLILYLRAEAIQTTNLMLLVIGSGLIFLSLRWLLVILISTLAGWGFIAASVQPSPGWIHFGFALLSSVAVSLMLHITRVRTLSRLEGLRLRDELRNAQLEAALGRSAQEIAERKKIEDQMRQLNELLEQRVRQRTERLHESNMRLSALIEASPLAIAVLSPEGTVQMWNPAAERIFGWSRGEATGRQLPIVPPDKSHEFEELIRRVLSGEAFTQIEAVAQRNDGAPVELNVSAAPLRNAGGAITGIMSVLTDITDRKDLENQLRQSQKMEAMGRLAGGVAHDFNNLLTVITGYGQLLTDRLAAEDPLRRYVEEMKRAGDRAASLTRHLLAFSRRQVLQPRVLNLTSAIIELDEMLRRLIGEDIDLVLVMEPELGWIKVDPGQVEQIILNLAVNSRDAMPQGGRITMETGNRFFDESYARRHVGLRAGPYVLLSVSDTGCGIPPEIQSQIFEPFFTTKETGKGTGLGLSTVYGIVEQSGGHIRVFSQMGRGTTFEIYFPRVEGRAAEKDSSAGLREEPRGSEVILLVEDEEMLRSMAREILEMAGYTVLDAACGPNALEVCKEYRGTIHLLLTDVVMPEMSGRELAETVTRDRPEIAVLYMSGYTDDAVLHHGVSELSTGFINKPFTPGALIRKVRQTLDSVRNT